MRIVERGLKQSVINGTNRVLWPWPIINMLNKLNTLGLTDRTIVTMNTKKFIFSTYSRKILRQVLALQISQNMLEIFLTLKKHLYNTKP